MAVRRNLQYLITTRALEYLRTHDNAALRAIVARGSGATDVERRAAKRVLALPSRAEGAPAGAAK